MTRVHPVRRFGTATILTHPEGRKRGEFLKRLAERQADELELETALHDFPDAAMVDELARDGVCTVTDERVSFAHDLLGDCARDHSLIGESNNLSIDLTSRLESPLWHRAVRLYATGLLEDNDDVGPWKQAVSFAEESGASPRPVPRGDRLSVAARGRMRRHR